ncbi:MAG: iron-containing alcohol dehydrogenase [Spirochaetota bacterium]
MMTDFLFTIPSKVYFGPDSIQKIGTVVAGKGKRAMLITEDILNEWDTVRHVQELLDKKGVACIVFDEVGTNSTSTVIDAALPIARGAQVHLIIGMGGVRALSLAKCIAKIIHGTRDIDEYISGALFPDTFLPYIEVPTTCRNPFMLTDSVLIIDGRDRTAHLLSTGSPADTIVFDPLLSMTLSDKYTAATMLDTFLYAVEGFFSRKSTFLSDLLFLKAAKILLENVVPASKNSEDKDVRVQASQAGLLTSVGLTVSGLGFGTMLSHVLSGKLMLPQSSAASILLPHILDWAVSACPGKIEHLVTQIGYPPALVEAQPGNEKDNARSRPAVFAEQVRDIISEVRLPLRLSDFEKTLQEFLELSDLVMNFADMKYLPSAVSNHDIRNILQKAF